ncbi:MAG: high-affinity branched-chain amino acid ABC transporter permease LivM, partial [Rhodospirillaceae bacterium]
GLVLAAEGKAGPVLIASILAGVGALVVPFPPGVLRSLALGGVAVVTIRAVWTLRTHRSTLSQAERDRRMDRFGARLQDASRLIGPVAVLFALVLPLLPFADRAVLDIGILLLTYIMLGWGLNIVVGLAGLLDLGYAAFFAVGAYSYALLAQYFGFSFWICLPLAGVMAALAGLLLGFPVLRLRGDYFAIVTLGFGEIIRIILLNWVDLTGGPVGVGGIPRPSFFGLADFAASPPEGRLAFHELFGLSYSSLHRIIFLYYLILALALLVNFFTLRIRKLPLGRAWEALREDDIACTALGINRTAIKLAAFSIAAMFGGFAGSFFATRQGFISPESFTFMESAMILAIVVLGGMGSQVGVVVATLLVIGLPEMFRELAEYRMLAFGCGMVLIMLWRPRGLLAHRDPTILLHKRKSACQQQAETEARG